MKRKHCAAMLIATLLFGSASLSATTLADAAEDYFPGSSAGEPALFPASGTGFWSFGAAAALDGGSNVAMEWDPGANVYENADADHNNGTPELLPLGHFALDELRTHPTLSRVAVMEWTAGADEGGTVLVSGHVRKIDTNGGDGVAFVVYVNGQNQSNGSIAFDDNVGQSFALLTSIAGGERIRLVIDDRSNELFDLTAFQMRIVADSLFTEQFETP